jgi:hypothetical protein
VSCGNCNNPETSVHIEGKKKQAILYLTCKGCGRRTDLDSTERFVKYMIQHPPSDADFGHAKTAAGSVGAALADATAAVGLPVSQSLVIVGLGFRVQGPLNLNLSIPCHCGFRVWGSGPTKPKSLNPLSLWVLGRGLVIVFWYSRRRVVALARGACVKGGCWW